MTIEIIGRDAEDLLSWRGIAAAIEAGHSLPRAEIADVLLYRGKDTLLSRAAWIDGLGSLVKTATIYPGNAARGLPTINGGVNLYADRDGTLDALVDFHLVTRWKTAGDSLLSAIRLARPDSRRILIVGAGAVARAMIAAYGSVFSGARFTIWNHRPEGARRLAAEVPGAVATEDLEPAVRGAEIIATCTMAQEPLIRGAWLQPGQHLDLIGAYTPTMREADDECYRRASVHVDSRATTVHHIGDLIEPIRAGVLSEADIRADFYDIPAGLYRRRTADEITLAKNGGGAHLDLMTARYILDAWRGR
jgi:ornithine cyclodeaminase